MSTTADIVNTADVDDDVDHDVAKFGLVCTYACQFTYNKLTCSSNEVFVALIWFDNWLAFANDFRLSPNSEFITFSACSKTELPSAMDADMLVAKKY